jgi:hypothetical protein
VMALGHSRQLAARYIVYVLSTSILGGTVPGTWVLEYFNIYRSPIATCKLTPAREKNWLAAAPAPRARCSHYCAAAGC